MITGSYGPERHLGGLESEFDRLESQAATSWPAERQLLQRAGLRDGMRVLELGCGSGAVTRRLRQLLPRSLIVALDRDDRMLAQARQTAIDGVEWRLGDADNIPFPPDYFHFILSRYLFQHLRDPHGTACDALRVLKPGGFHAIVDVDDDLWGLAQPSFPALKHIFAKSNTARVLNGSRRTVGRDLGRILRRAGYTDVLLEVFSYDSDAQGLAGFLPQMQPERLFADFPPEAVSVEEMASMFMAVEQFQKDSSAFVLLTGFFATGTKPV